MGKCYVYGLYDPNTDELFYVGKGTGYRDTSHLKPSMWSNPKNTTNPFLYYKIKSLMENETPPIIKRLHENVSEEDAYRLENELVLKYGRRFSVENGKLFNISEFMGGNKKGKELTWTEERLKTWHEFQKKRRKYDPSYEELYDDYITRNMKRVDIAEKYDVSDVLVKKRLQHFGIKKPKHLQYGDSVKHVCVNCNKHFETSPSVQRKYCSKVCYRDYMEKHK
jgi:hypothetical protein